MSISSYDENEQWTIVDKFSMDVIHNAAIDIIRRHTATTPTKTRSFFVISSTDITF